MIGKGTSENSNEERAKKEEFLRETFLKSMAEAGFQLRGKESEGGGVGSATTTTNGVSNKLAEEALRNRVKQRYELFKIRKQGGTVASLNQQKTQGAAADCSASMGNRIGFGKPPGAGEAPSTPEVSARIPTPPSSITAPIPTSIAENGGPTPPSSTPEVSVRIPTPPSSITAPVPTSIAENGGPTPPVSSGENSPVDSEGMSTLTTAVGQNNETEMNFSTSALESPPPEKSVHSLGDNETAPASNLDQGDTDAEIGPKSNELVRNPVSSNGDEEDDEVIIVDDIDDCVQQNVLPKNGSVGDDICRKTSSSSHEDITSSVTSSKVVKQEKILSSRCQTFKRGENGAADAEYVYSVPMSPGRHEEDDDDDDVVILSVPSTMTRTPLISNPNEASPLHKNCVSATDGISTGPVTAVENENVSSSSEIVPARIVERNVDNIDEGEISRKRPSDSELEKDGQNGNTNSKRARLLSDEANSNTTDLHDDIGVGESGVSSVQEEQESVQSPISSGHKEIQDASSIEGGKSRRDQIVPNDISSNSTTHDKDNSAPLPLVPENNSALQSDSIATTCDVSVEEQSVTDVTSSIQKEQELVDGISGQNTGSTVPETQSVISPETSNNVACTPNTSNISDSPRGASDHSIHTENEIPKEPTDKDASTQAAENIDETRPEPISIEQGIQNDAQSTTLVGDNHSLSMPEARVTDTVESEKEKDGLSDDRQDTQTQLNPIDTISTSAANMEIDVPEENVIRIRKDIYSDDEDGEEEKDGNGNKRGDQLVADSLSLSTSDINSILGPSQLDDENDFSNLITIHAVTQPNDSTSTEEGGAAATVTLEQLLRGTPCATDLSRNSPTTQQESSTSNVSTNLINSTVGAAATTNCSLSPTVSNNEGTSGSSTGENQATTNKQEAILNLICKRRESMTKEMYNFQRLIQGYFVNTPNSSSATVPMVLTQLEQLLRPTFEFHRTLDVAVLGLKHSMGQQNAQRVLPDDVDLTIEELTEYFSVLFQGIMFIRVCKKARTKSVVSIIIHRIIRLLHYFMVGKDPSKAEQKFNNVTSMILMAPALTKLDDSDKVKFVVSVWESIRANYSDNSDTNGAGARLDHVQCGVSHFRTRMEKLMNTYYSTTTTALQPVGPQAQHHQQQVVSAPNNNNNANAANVNASTSNALVRSAHQLPGENSSQQRQHRQQPAVTNIQQACPGQYVMVQPGQQHLQQQHQRMVMPHGIQYQQANINNASQQQQVPTATPRVLQSNPNCQAMVPSQQQQQQITSAHIMQQNHFNRQQLQRQLIQRAQRPICSNQQQQSIHRPQQNQNSVPQIRQAQQQQYPHVSGYSNQPTYNFNQVQSAQAQTGSNHQNNYHQNLNTPNGSNYQMAAQYQYQQQNVVANTTTFPSTSKQVFSHQQNAGNNVSQTPTVRSSPHSQQTVVDDEIQFIGVTQRQSATATNAGQILQQQQHQQVSRTPATQSQTTAVGLVENVQPQPTIIAHYQGVQVCNTVFNGGGHGGTITNTQTQALQRQRTTPTDFSNARSSPHQSLSTPPGPGHEQILLHHGVNSLASGSSHGRIHSPTNHTNHNRQNYVGQSTQSQSQMGLGQVQQQRSNISQQYQPGLMQRQQTSYVTGSRPASNLNSNTVPTPTDEQLQAQTNTVFLPDVTNGMPVPAEIVSGSNIRTNSGDGRPNMGQSNWGTGSAVDGAQFGAWS